MKLSATHVKSRLVSSASNGRACAVMMVMASLVSACMPPIMHGPKIESGWGGGVMAASTTGPEYTEGDLGGVRLRSGLTGVFLGRGYAPRDSSSPGLYVGVAYPGLPFIGDLFVQAPPKLLSPFSVGAGVVASIDNQTYYAEFGDINQSDDGWFLLQGVSRRRVSSYHDPGYAWVSGATYKYRGVSGNGYAFVQYAIGSRPHLIASRDTELDKPFYSLSFGITLEARGKPKH